MHEAIKQVFSLSKEILESPTNQHVFLDKNGIDRFLNEHMIPNPPTKTQVDDNEINIGQMQKAEIVLDELVSDSINYCFWLFNASIRPNGSGSTKMRDILHYNFDARNALRNEINFKYEIRRFISALHRRRFPMMEKRIKHLTALTRPHILRSATSLSAHDSNLNVGSWLVSMIIGNSFENCFNFLITEIDGYGDDPFLKRACLFFLQLNRILGLYEDEVKSFPLPADYQVPKMMRWYGLLRYSDELTSMIVGGEHLQENGPMEMAIRAATIEVGRFLCEKTGWSASDVDGWFFTRRHDAENFPFHLCQTSNY